MGEEKGGGWSNIEQVTCIPSSMDVPEMRRDISKGQNVAWLLRNLGVNNRTHLAFEETMCMLKDRSRAEGK